MKNSKEKRQKFIWYATASIIILILFFVWEALLMKGIIVFPQIINFGFIGFRTYGILITIGVALLTYIINREKKHIKKIKKVDMADLLIFTLFGGILGARLYHLATDWRLYAANPISALYFWNGGLGIFGAIVGGILALLLYSKFKKFDLFTMIDLIAVFMPLAQIVGRAGNLVNQEIVGLPTTLPWSWKLANLSTTFHPVFLYEQIGDLLLFVLLFWFYKTKKVIGNLDLTLIYLAGYSVVRFIVEFWRSEPKIIFSTFTLNQAVCVFVIIFSVIVYRFRYKLLKLNKEYDL